MIQDMINSDNMNMNSVFSVFRLNLFAFKHWMTFSNSGVSFSLVSPHGVICLLRFVSSAYIFIFVPSILLGKSFI